MDADFCRNCPRLEMLLIENTQRGYRKTQKQPFRTVFIQLKCNGVIMANERIGNSEFVSEDYAMLCEPNGVCSNIITTKFLSKQMMDDYDNAVSRAFSRIDGYVGVELPPHCVYEFEQEMSEISR